MTNTQLKANNSDIIPKVYTNRLCIPIYVDIDEHDNISINDDLVLSDYGVDYILLVVFRLYKDETIEVMSELRPIDRILDSGKFEVNSEFNIYFPKHNLRYDIAMYSEHNDIVIKIQKKYIIFDCCTITFIDGIESDINNVDKSGYTMLTRCFKEHVPSIKLIEKDSNKNIIREVILNFKRNSQGEYVYENIINNGDINNPNYVVVTLDEDNNISEIPLQIRSSPNVWNLYAPKLGTDVPITLTDNNIDDFETNCNIGDIINGIIYPSIITSVVRNVEDNSMSICASSGIYLLSIVCDLNTHEYRLENTFTYKLEAISEH